MQSLLNLDSIEVTAVANAYERVGVILGSSEGDSIRNVSSRGYVSGEERVGGFIGKGKDLIIKNTYNAAIVDNTSLTFQ